MLPDRSILIGQKLVENAKIQIFKCDILRNFQTMWRATIFSSFAMKCESSVGEMNQKNLYGDTLELCSLDPCTGWFRDGYARTDSNDQGTHVACATMTQEVQKRPQKLPKIILNLFSFWITPRVKATICQLLTFPDFQDWSLVTVGSFAFCDGMKLKKPDMLHYWNWRPPIKKP